MQTRNAGTQRRRSPQRSFKNEATGTCHIVSAIDGQVQTSSADEQLSCEKLSYEKPYFAPSPRGHSLYLICGQITARNCGRSSRGPVRLKTELLKTMPGDGASAPPSLIARPRSGQIRDGEDRPFLSLEGFNMRCQFGTKLSATIPARAGMKFSKLCLRIAGPGDVR
jgi:hypothetical protein